MIEPFLTYLRTERRYSELTVKAYGDDLRQFVLFCLQGEGSDEEPVSSESEEVMKSFDPRGVTADDLRAWIVSLTGEKKLSARSVNRKISAVKAYFRYLRKEHVVEKDLFTRISALKTSGRLPVFVEEMIEAVFFVQPDEALIEYARSTRRGIYVVEYLIIAAAGS